MNPTPANIKTPIIGISGWKKSGKTTLTVRLVAEFTRRGYRVATVKHAHHEFQVDDGETDSARHRRAGAGEVAIVGGKRWAIVHELDNEPEPEFAEVISWLSPADLILVEGYKTAPIPKIEARCAQSMTKTRLSDEDPMVIAIATDGTEGVADGDGLPVFSRDDIMGLATFIERTIGPLQRRFGEPAKSSAPGAPIGMLPRTPPKA